MPKTLEISYKGKESGFTLKRIERSKLYGSKRRLAVDGQGNECSRAALTRDGRYILPNGGTAMLYLDEQGDVAERNQLRGIYADGEVIAPGEVSSNEALELTEGGAVQVLEYSITRAYALEPVFLSPELETSLSQGAIYRLSLSNYPGCNGRQSFLLSNDRGYFLLIGEHTGFEFIGVAEADLSPPEIGEDEYDVDDNLDFGML